MMNGTQTGSLVAEIVARVEDDAAKRGHSSQLVIALRRAAEQDCHIDPEAPVAAFGSAF